MKKKLLITAVAATVALSSMGALAACGDDSAQNAEIAQKAIATVRNLYADKGQETPIDYPVIGQTNVDGVFYTINWSVTSDVADYGNYVVVGDAGELVTIHITQTTVAVEYKLIASVTVGESTETAEFSRKIPAKAEEHAGTLEDPFAVANVREIGAGLASNKYYVDEDGNPKQIYVKGYVVDPGTPYSGGGRINNAYIVDEYAADKDKNSEGALNVYTLSYDSTVFTGQYPLKHGDLVVLVGYIQNYNGTTIEITYSGSNVVNCVSLTAAPDNRTADEKAQAAVDAATLVTDKFTEADEITLPTSTVAGVTLEWTVATNDYVTITNNVLTIGSNVPATEATVDLTVTGTIDGVSKDKTVTIKLQQEASIGLEHAGTATDPYNISDANKRLATVASGKIYQVNGKDKEVYITGYVIDGGTVGDRRLNNVYLADAADTAKADALLVYGISWDEEKLPQGTTLPTGVLVVIKGYLKDYNGTKEVAQSSASVYPSVVSVAQDTRTNAEKVATVKTALTLGTTYNVSGDVTLPQSTVRGVTVTWASNNALVTIAEDGSKMTIGEIPEGAATPVAVTATITCGEGADAASDTKTFNISLVKATAPVAGTYKLALERGSLATLYFTGEMSGYYGATTTSIVNAADIVLSKSGDDYTMRIGTDGKYIEVSINGTHINFTLADTPSTTAKWQYSSTYRTLTWKIGEDEYWIGTNGTYTTVGAYNVTKLADSNQYPVSFQTYNPSESSDAEKVELALGALSATLDDIDEIGETPLPASSVDGVTFNWTLHTDNTAENVSVAGNALTVSALPTGNDATVKLLVTATCGEVSTDNTKTVTVKVLAPSTVNYGDIDHPLSVSEALALGKRECPETNNFTKQVVYVTGKVTVTPNYTGSYYQTFYLQDLDDPTTTIQVYSINLANGVDFDSIAQNDVLKIYGYIKKQNATTWQFSSNSGTYVYAASNVRGDSTITLDIMLDNDVATATVTGLVATQTKTNGTEVTFTVEAIDGKEISAVNVGGNKINPTETNGNTYKFTVAGNTTVRIETKNEGEADNPTAQIDYSAKGYENSTTMDGVDVNDNKNIITVKFAKGTGSNGPAYYTTGTGVRFYPNNTITVSASSSYEIVKITFTWTNGTNAITVDSGELKSNVWTGTASSVTFTSGGSSGHYRIQKIDIEYKATATATNSEPTTQTLSLPEALPVDEQ